MERNPIRVCELLVGLPAVNVVGVEDVAPVEPLRVHVETRGSRPRCPQCSGRVGVKDRVPWSWSTCRVRPAGTVGVA